MSGLGFLGSDGLPGGCWLWWISLVATLTPTHRIWVVYNEIHDWIIGTLFPPTPALLCMCEPMNMIIYRPWFSISEVVNVIRLYIVCIIYTTQAIIILYYTYTHVYRFPGEVCMGV